ncbi:MAG: peptidylprolyl isomerase [Chloroflexi bacterium]|nr:peptidylprolyl isomerase [Chloroflexota bacterium]
MKRLAPFAGLVLVLVACGTDPAPTPASACPTEAPTSASAQATLENAGFATMQIGGAVEGEVVMELDSDGAPLATASFVALARCGFYDGVTFHRVIADFVIQAGDPGTRDNRGDFEGVGQGDPGYEFEIEPPADGLRYDPHVVAMANDGRANGSQFFITLADLDAQLRAVGVYSILGTVVEGTDIVDAVAQVPVSATNLPLTPVIIESITISAAEPSPGG